jgi:hypothetical protein
MSGSPTEPPESGSPESTPKADSLVDPARELESRRRDAGERTSEERPDSSAYRIERQAILLRRQRWAEASEVDDDRERPRVRAAPYRPPDPVDPSGLSQFERPHPKPEPEKGLGGWVRGMWRRWTS